MSGAPKRRQGHSVEPAGWPALPRCSHVGTARVVPQVCPPSVPRTRSWGLTGHTLSRPNRSDTTDAARAAARCSVTEGWFPVRVETVLPKCGRSTTRSLALVAPDPPNRNRGRPEASPPRGWLRQAMVTSACPRGPPENAPRRWRACCTHSDRASQGVSLRWGRADPGPPAVTRGF